MILGILYIDQLPGITFNETYAPVLAWSLLDLLLYLLHIEKCLSIDLMSHIMISGGIIRENKASTTSVKKHERNTNLSKPNEIESPCGKVKRELTPLSLSRRGYIKRS